MRKRFFAKNFNSNEHFDRSFSFYRSGTQTPNQKERKNNESTDSLQKNTNSTTSYRTGACRDRHVRIPASARDTAVRFYEHKLVICQALRWAPTSRLAQST